MRDSSFKKRILYTRHDGGVSICHPSLQTLLWMCFGGYWMGRPRGFVAEQIRRQVEAGLDERAAHRFAHAVAYGGCTTAEALEIIRDRDCGHKGTAHELVHIDDIPKDRWFRNAWRRSGNGGPISVDLGKARRIQFSRIKAVAAAEEKRRSTELDLFDRPVELPWGTLRDRIHAASDVDELRRVWPEELRP